MTPDDINVITLDGNTHTVMAKTPITITAQTGAIEMVDYAQPDGSIVQAEGRTSFQVTTTAGTRFTCACGISFDAANDGLSDPRFDQGAAVDCPSC